MAELKRKVTMRPPLTDEENAQITAIATRHGLSKEAAAAILLNGGARLASMGDSEINRKLREAGEQYRTSRSRSRRRPKKIAKSGRLIGATAGS